MDTQLFLFHETRNENKPKSSLEDILECLDSIPHIARGGCGISALAIYRWCKANDYQVSDRPFVFLFRENDEWEAEHNDESLENGILESVEIPAHVVIELDGILQDTSGEANYDGLPIQQNYRLNESELLYVLNEKYGGWNDEFSRKRSIPKIEIGLGIDLSDVKI